MPAERGRVIGGLMASALLVSCGGGDSGPQLVEVELVVASSAPTGGTLSEFQRADGWVMHLERATVQLGAVYLRAPKYHPPMAAWWRLLVPMAHAHTGHAQTLTEGQVIGEHLEPIEVDALAAAPVAAGLFASEAAELDRLSVVLGRGLMSSAPVAHIKGYAEREGEHVDFDCSLHIAQDADDTPENIEERRRVDQIRLSDTPRVSAGAQLRIHLQLGRWLEWVDFDALVGSASVCSAPRSALSNQWYLGLRRPEAFAAELISKE
jgi:hypothetical protein